MSEPTMGIKVGKDKAVITFNWQGLYTYEQTVFYIHRSRQGIEVCVQCRDEGDPIPTRLVMEPKDEQTVTLWAYPQVANEK